MLKKKRGNVLEFMMFLFFSGLLFFPENSAFGQSSDEFHRDAIVVDAHAHNLNINNDDSSNQLNLKMLEEGGIDLVGLYFGGYPQKNKTLLEKVSVEITNLQKQINSGNYKLSITTNSDQILNAINNGRIAILPGIEYFYGVLENELSTIDSLYELGVRSLTLIDNERDVLSVKTQDEQSTATLSGFAKSLINRMNQLGMMIDISHLNDEMQLAVIEYSDSPVIASHSPLRAVQYMERNIPDKILKNMAEKGGAIMLTFNSGILAGVKSGRTNIEYLIDHIMHAIQVAGIDHVGIGSDFNGSGLRSPKKLENASGFPNISAELFDRGLSEDEVEKILGLNFLNLFGNIEGLAQN